MTQESQLMTEAQIRDNFVVRLRRAMAEADMLNPLQLYNAMVEFDTTMSPSQAYRWYNGKTLPRLHRMYLLAAVLGIEHWEDLLGSAQP